MSGTGKTSLLEALAARGHLTVDTDHHGWTGADGRWDEPRMAALLARETTVAVSGTVDNQGRFYDRFDDVVLLSAPVEVLLSRVRTRTGNPYGRTPEHEAEIRQYLRDVEPLLRRGATLELDGRDPIEELADVVENRLVR
jgi:shikimate kinase